MQVGAAQFCINRRMIQFGYGIRGSLELFSLPLLGVQYIDSPEVNNLLFSQVLQTGYSGLVKMMTSP